MTKKTRRRTAPLNRPTGLDRPFPLPRIDALEPLPHAAADLVADEEAGDFVLGEALVLLEELHDAIEVLLRILDQWLELEQQAGQIQECAPGVVATFRPEVREVEEAAKRTSLQFILQCESQSAAT